MLSQGSLGEVVIKGPARLTVLAKSCSLPGQDFGFIGSRTGGRDRGAHQSQVSEFSKVFVKSALKVRDI